MSQIVRLRDGGVAADDDVGVVGLLTTSVEYLGEALTYPAFTFTGCMGT